MITKKLLKELYGINQSAWEVQRPKVYKRAVYGLPVGTIVVAVGSGEQPYMCRDAMNSLEMKGKIGNISYRDVDNKVRFQIVAKVHHPFDVSRILYILQKDDYYVIIEQHCVREVK